MNAALRILAWLLAVGLVALPVVAVLNGWVGAERWPLSHLRVTGVFKRVPAEQLREVVLPYARAGFFAIDLQGMQDAIRRLPWVENAQVRKRWPDVLEVHVVEHRPFARWGKDRMLSEQGQLFPAPPQLKDFKLPQLGGPDNRIQDVVELYNASCTLFAPTGLHVERLEMDARGSWSLGLSDGMQIVIGHDDVEARLQRFAHVLPQLRDPAWPIVRVDLRYTNGFAVSRGPAPDANGSITTPHPPAAVLTLPLPATPMTALFRHVAGYLSAFPSFSLRSSMT